MPVDLKWLPVNPNWKEELAVLKTSAGDCWTELQRLSKYRLDFVQTAKLDREAQRLYKEGRVNPESSVRVALLGSSTLKHLIASIRVAGLRWGLWFVVYEGGYGQYLQELMSEDQDSELARFRPEFVVLSLDARHLAELTREGISGALERMIACWKRAKTRFAASVIQQTGLPVFEDVFGSNEYRLVESAQSRLQELNAQLRTAAEREGVNLLTLDKYVSLGGTDAWHDPALWHLAKQEVHPEAAPMYGDLLARLISAQRGRSAKCLVVDLDNTLWGGVVGDDGIENLVLSQGDAAGEAYRAFQRYCLELKQRGVLLAVCSKNDDWNARAPFRERKEMELGEKDFACFVANWSDKATNLRAIAERLKIGLDALVFVDDNPAERELIRRELPEVSVPELPDDPAGFVRCVARAGYFEGLVVTEEDRKRAACYAANEQREELRASSTDLRGYLRSLKMEMAARPFDEAGMQRIVQLANKTNQFNVTTWRLSETEVLALMKDPCVMTWQVGLQDKFGDHGVIALLGGRLDRSGTFEVLLWLMSCRVLGRGVEEACVNMMVKDVLLRGGGRVEGIYRPTAKNGIVKNLFQRMGFEDMGNGERWALDATSFVARETEVEVITAGRFWKEGHAE